MGIIRESGGRTEEAEQTPHPPNPNRRQPSWLARALLAGGTTGNERLTALTGVLLIALLAALGITILRIRPLLNIHMFLGIVLIGPLALKLGSTGYRFVRYYTANPRYRRKGPPPAYLRLLAPGVVLSTVVVFSSGVALLLIGPSSRGALLGIHKVSFIVWSAFTGVHVLGHLADLQRALRPSNVPQYEHYAPGRAGRIISVSSALVAGVLLAILAEPRFAAWIHADRLPRIH
ncbi:MAG TPA: hypothetical protein VGF15_06495 [Solirubrobacteraceae bacterium]|jgi:hypothetical protein